MRYFLILSIFISQFCYGQKCLNDSLFNRFKNDIQIELNRHHNRVVWDDETRKSYYTLMSSCPVEHLTKYVEDSIPSIRAIIFSGLALKNMEVKLLEDILQKHQNDTAEHIEGSTDIVITSTVIGHMQNMLKWKIEKKPPITSVDFKSRLKTLDDRLREINRIIIPGSYHDIISKEDLLSVDSLTCSLSGFKVLSFNLSIADKTFTNKSSVTEEMKDAIRAMAIGDLLFIEDIKVEVPDKSWRKLGSMMLEVR